VTGRASAGSTADLALVVMVVQNDKLIHLISLTGTVPREISKWENIATAYFHDNRFNGTMPNIRNTFCPIDNSFLLNALGADCGEIVCDCCNDCH
jgi:hypothetical protein